MDEAGEEDAAGDESIVREEPPGPQRPKRLPPRLFDKVHADREEHGHEAAQPAVGCVGVELLDQELDALFEVDQADVHPEGGRGHVGDEARVVAEVEDGGEEVEDGRPAASLGQSLGALDGFW